MPTQIQNLLSNSAKIFSVVWVNYGGCQLNLMAAKIKLLSSGRAC